MTWQQVSGQRGSVPGSQSCTLRGYGCWIRSESFIVYIIVWQNLFHLQILALECITVVLMGGVLDRTSVVATQDTMDLFLVVAHVSKAI